MIICEDCVRVFDRSRADARKAGWEPNSFTSQWAIDEGPMTCPDCVLRLINAVIDALHSYTGPWPV